LATLQVHRTLHQEQRSTHLNSIHNLGLRLLQLAKPELMAKRAKSLLALLVPAGLIACVKELDRMV
jgi:hypothetical protein